MRHRSNCLVKMHRAFDVGDGSQGTVDVEYLMESCKRRAKRRWQRTQLNDDRGERRSHLELVTGRSCCPPTGLSEVGSTIQVTWHLQPLPHTLINLGKQQMRGMLHVNHSLGGHGLRVRVVRFSLIQPSSPPIANFILHVLCHLKVSLILGLFTCVLRLDISICFIQTARRYCLPSIACVVENRTFCNTRPLLFHAPPDLDPAACPLTVSRPYDLDQHRPPPLYRRFSPLHQGTLETRREMLLVRLKQRRIDGNSGVVDDSVHFQVRS